MAESWNKKEREKKKQKEKKEKAEKKQERKENAKKSSFDDMIAYLDENGNLTNTPPDPRNKKEIKLEDIEIGVPVNNSQSNPEDKIRNGKVTFFNTAKGFGFIKDSITQESFFVHINNAIEPIQENDKVSFETEMGPKGQMAVNVKIIN